MAELHLVMDIGQTGMRAQVRHPGNTSPLWEDEFPGVRTDLPIFPQFAEVTRIVIERSGLAPSVLTAGVSGLLESDDVRNMLALVRPYGVERVVFAHDSVTSYLGALGDRRGVVSAVGTGIVTLGVGASEVWRVDGWGNLIGDAGSGFWIGRHGLDAVMRAYDGRGPETALTQIALRDFPVLPDAYIELQGDPRRISRVASYAREVDALAQTDEVCGALMRRAASEIFVSCEAALRHVREDVVEHPLVCLLGNVSRSQTLRAEFLRLLDERWPGTTLTDPVANSLEGAALLPVLPTDSAVRTKVADVS